MRRRSTSRSDGGSSARASGQELLGVEGVALGALEQVLDELGGGRLTQNRLHLLRELGARERRQLEPAHSAHAREFGNEASQRMVPMHVLIAQGGQQQHARAPRRADEERQKVPSRAVSPVQVLDDEDQRPRGGQARQQCQHEREDPVLTRVRAIACVLGAGRSQLGPQPGELGAIRAGESVGQYRLAKRGAKRGHDGAIRQLTLGQLEALAHQHEPSLCGRPPFDLADQTALADAGVAGDEHDARLGGQRGQFTLPADKTLAGHGAVQLGREPGKRVLDDGGHGALGDERQRRKLLVALDVLRWRRRRRKRLP